MKTLNMRDLTEALINRGYDAKYEMTGGNCGTIYLYHQEEEKFGEIFLAIGPSNFDSGIAYDSELNWGAFDNDEENWGDPIGDSAYFEEELLGDFTVENVANAIDDWQL